jgi:transposase
MKINQSPKAEMRALNGLPDSPASQRARRATGDAGESASRSKPPVSDTEVVPRAQRRKFTSADKRRIVQAADGCVPHSGQLGALMRRECVYSSSLSTWRRQIKAGDLNALAPQKRGPKADPGKAHAQQLAQLTRERDRLKSQLDKAQLVIEVQKKVATLLALLEADNKPESN